MTQADLDARSTAAPRGDQPKRRVYTADYKARILAEHEATPKGERGAFLRREGLYTGHITSWRRAAENGANAGLGPKRMDKRDKEIADLKNRAEKAESELAKTKAALDLVGKAHALLEALFENADSDKK